MANDNTTFTTFRAAGKPTKRTGNDALMAVLLATATELESARTGEETPAAVAIDNALFVPTTGAKSVLFVDCTPNRVIHGHVRAAIEAGLLPKGVIPLPGRPEGSKNKPKAAPAPVEAAPVADATPAPVEAAPAAPVEATPA